MLSFSVCGIPVGRSEIPFETESPFVTSGIRVGTPALTTRGMKEKDMELIATFFEKVLNNPNDDSVKKNVANEVKELCKRFPLYED